MIYKGLRFKVRGDLTDNAEVYTISGIRNKVFITWKGCYTPAPYDLLDVQNMFSTGIWIPIHNTKDFLKAIKKCIKKENHS